MTMYVKDQVNTQFMVRPEKPGNHSGHHFLIDVGHYKSTHS